MESTLCCARSNVCPARIEKPLFQRVPWGKPCLQLLSASGLGRHIALEEDFVDVQLEPSAALRLGAARDRLNEMIYLALVPTCARCGYPITVTKALPGHGVCAVNRH